MKVDPRKPGNIIDYITTHVSCILRNVTGASRNVQVTYERQEKFSQNYSIKFL